MRYGITLLAAVFLTLAGCRVGEPADTGRTPNGPPVDPARQAVAATRLSAAREAYDAGEMERARAGAEEVLRAYPRTSSATPALWLAARTAFELGDYEAAETLANRYASRFDRGSVEASNARELAADAQRALESRQQTVMIGAILPLSGSAYLKRYADLVLEGMQLAVDAYERQTGTPIELVVRDDQGQFDRAGSLARDLEDAGATAILGPMLSDGVRAAAQARLDSAIALVSPTASERPMGWPNVYSLNAGDTRGATALADYLTSAGVYRAGVMYPAVEPYVTKARAFMDHLQDAGGNVVLNMPYDSGTTTFARQLRRAAEVSPRALFVPAPEGDVRQIAPQIQFYGLDTASVQIVGDEAWVSERVLRVVEAPFLEGVIAATYSPATQADRAREEFVDLYEQTYRRTLTNRFPALGYDAARLILAALVPGQNRPAEIADRLRAGAPLRGATGILSLAGGEITRQPYLVQVRNGGVVAAPTPEEFARSHPLGPAAGDTVADSIDGSMERR